MLCLTPPAWAEPSGGEGELTSSPTISLADLGGTSSVSFYVDRTSYVDLKTPGASVSFPVPSGLTPVALRAKLELPLNLQAATITAAQGGRTLTRMALPVQDQSEIVIPLDGMRVSGGWASVGLAMDALPLDNTCWKDDARVRFVDVAVTFSGTEAAPGNVADFLPAVLGKVTIALPTTPSMAEASAAVQVAAAVANRNGQKPEVVFAPLPPGQTRLAVPSGPMERQIVVKEGPETGLSLHGDGGVPALLITGRGPEITEQARLLNDQSLRLAAGPRAVAGPLPAPDLFADSVTVAELANAKVTSEATWPKVSIPLDQTRFSHPLRDIQVHLMGSYTPIPNVFGAEVSVAVDGEEIDRWAVTPDGAIDRVVTIPNQEVKRLMSLDVVLRSTGNLGNCSEHLPATLRIDGNTAIRAVEANPPVPQGFQAFPQALMPEVQFGIGERDVFADARRAAQIAVGLQRFSVEPLNVTVTSVGQALASGRSAVLVSPGGWTDAAVRLPFSVNGGKLTVRGIDTNGDNAALTVDDGVKFGSVQTVFDGNRSLLIFTSNGAPNLVDGLLTWLAAPGRFSGLDGRAVISVPDTDPVIVPSPPVAAPDAAQGGATRPQGGQAVFWLAAGAVTMIATLLGIRILLRARHT